MLVETVLESRISSGMYSRSNATDGAFAALLADMSVITWGYAVAGGYSSGVQEQLRNVQQIQATGRAFAALLADRSLVMSRQHMVQLLPSWRMAVVAHGDPDAGGDSSSVQDQLRNVTQIQVTYGAFAAMLGDGSVVTWGDPDAGGDSSRVQNQLRNVQQIRATYRAFAAILADGSVVTWGNPNAGGDSFEVRDQLAYL
eukprot:s979_g19.t1